MGNRVFGPRESYADRAKPLFQSVTTGLQFQSMHRTWTWTFELPPDQLWPLLADTERFNEALGLPPYTLEETPRSNGTVLRRGRGKVAGFVLEWEEKPCEWISGRHFRQSRVFSKGPFRRFGPTLDLESVGDGGSRVTYVLEWEPLTMAGRVFGARLAAQAGENVARRIQEVVAFASKDQAPERLTPFILPEPKLPQGARERAISVGTRNRPQRLRKRPRQPARRPGAARHGRRSHPHPAQVPGPGARCATARRDRSLPRPG